MKRLIAAFARNLVFANILLGTIVIGGGIGASLMVRELFPEMSIDIIVVSVPYPGADPEEIEEGICRKIEEGIDSIVGIKRYTTLSSENVGHAIIEVKENSDVTDVKDRVRNAVDSISNFPVDAERPIIEEILFRSEVMFLTLWGDLSDRTLKEWGERLKDELQLLPEVSQVGLFGARQYEIAVELSEDRMREYGLTFSNVANAIRASSLNSPGGTIRGEGEQVRLVTRERKYTGKEFADIIVKATPTGDVIRLDRIATVKDGFTEDPVIAQFNGKRCVLMQVLNTSEEDALVISDAVYKWIDDKRDTLPEGVNISVMTDISKHLRGRINLLTRNGMIGLTLVFVLLWLFLDLRLSFWAAMGIPISLAGALAIMWAIGASINMISLFGLIMVLGIIVDDAIVVGEAIYVHRKEGAPPLKAAVDGVMEVGLPVVAAVTTTIVAFLPLCFVGGIMGKFILILPIAVICTLTISLVECLILLPAHLNHLPDPNREIAPGHPWKQRAQRYRRSISHGMEWFVVHMYGPVVAKAVAWRYVALSIATTVLLITLGLYQGGFIRYEMFPNVDGDELTAEITFPDGTPLEVTADAVNGIVAALRRLENHFTTVSGKPLIKNTFSLAGSNIGDQEGNDVGPQYGAVRCDLLESADRGVHSRDITVAWEEEIGAIPGALALSIIGMQTGPPGASLEIWVQGEDMDKILTGADELMAKLGGIDGLYQIQSDFRPGKRELRMKLKPEAQALGLTVADLAGQVYAGYYGEEALRIQRGRDDIRVKVRYTADERSRLSQLDEVRIRTPFGTEVPLMSVADIDYGPGFSTIKRTNALRRVAVSAEVDNNKVTTQEVLDELNLRFFPKLMADNPGLSVSIEGSQKENREAMDSLFIGFLLALMGIYVIIATIFRSYIQPFVIMVTVPFGIIGAIHSHFLMGFIKGTRMDLTMMSLFGIVALAGVVVNDAIVLIECVNNMIADGVPFYEAIRRGGARRFRAIFLTTVSTVGGLMPMIVERDMQAQFLIPMALSIAGGVAFATLLTLLLIPALLAIVNDIRRLTFAIWNLRWPTPEEVEPARLRKRDPLAEGM
ncbi:MAG: efflux RND transporter permease subunit [bacterium]|nr:efflux RND transporter permease subunit [bacterium]